MEETNNNILKFIKSIRESFPDATIIYTYGACYGFYKILKTIFPSSTPYHTKEYDHIVTKIGNQFYDISGEYIDCNMEVRADDLKKLTTKEKIFWESVVSGQRVEFMIKKYERT